MHPSAASKHRNIRLPDDKGDPVSGRGAHRAFSERAASRLAAAGTVNRTTAMTVQLVADALMMAIWRRGKPDALLHHSDRDSQYTVNSSSG